VPLQSLAASPPPARHFAGPAPLARDRVVPEPCGCRLSWGSCSHERHYVGCPVSPVRPESRSGGRGVATPPVGAVLRVLAPLDGSGHARGTHEPLRVRRLRGAPTLRGLVPCRSRPWNYPPELSLPEEPYPLSRASCFLAGFALRLPPAQSRRDLRDRFPCRASSLPASSAEAVLETHEPGREFPAVARRSPRHAAKRGSDDRPFPSTLGSPVSGRHARFEALLPSGVRSLDDPEPWPGRGRRVGALLGFFPSRASSTTVQGAVSRADARSRDEPCTSHAAGNPATSLR